jgi:hypothetical protein
MPEAISRGRDDSLEATWKLLTPTNGRSLLLQPGGRHPTAYVPTYREEAPCDTARPARFPGSFQGFPNDTQLWGF